MDDTVLELIRSIGESTKDALKNIESNMKDRQNRHEEHISEQLRTDREQLKNSHNAFMAEYESMQRGDENDKKEIGERISKLYNDMRKNNEEMCDVKHVQSNHYALIKNQEEKFESHIKEHQTAKEEEIIDAKLQTRRIIAAITAIGTIAIGAMVTAFLKTIGIIP
jgi:hypothetical protein